MNFIITPLRWIIDLLYSWVGSYSIAIILFTLVVKLILLPLDIKQRHSMRKMQLIQPKVDEINKKYEKDPEKRSAKTMEVQPHERLFADADSDAHSVCHVRRHAPYCR